MDVTQLKRLNLILQKILLYIVLCKGTKTEKRITYEYFSIWGLSRH